MRLLGASWRLLAARFLQLGVKLAYLGASWAHLGASWAHLGASWGDLGTHFADNLPPSCPRDAQEHLPDPANLDFFDFWTDFAFLAAVIIQATPENKHHDLDVCFSGTFAMQHATRKTMN